MTETISISEQSLPACFSQVVAAHASRIALVSASWQPSYGELDATANRLAHGLLQHGGIAGDRVALLMRHDVFLFCAMLSVLKAGMTVVVLNPTDPPERLRSQIGGCKTPLDPIGENLSRVSQRGRL